MVLLRALKSIPDKVIELSRCFCRQAKVAPLAAPQEKNADYKRYWIEDNLSNIIPLAHDAHPEGFNPGEYLAEIISPFTFNSLLDFGCGYGRLTASFDKDKYIGVDLNPLALQKATEDNPGYRYYEIDVEAKEYPNADIGLAYTVFLHLDDLVLDNTLSILLKYINKYFIVAEILGREWRRPGNPPVFNREKEEYIHILQKYKFHFIKQYDRQYMRYVTDKKFENKVNKNISFLVFKKEE